MTMRKKYRRSKHEIAKLALLFACITAPLAASPAKAGIVVDSDPILFWNQVIVDVLTLGPPAQTRVAAMMNIAMHDAANSILGSPNNGYLTGVTGFGGDMRAAISQAAYNVLVANDTNPSHVATYQSALAQSLALVTDPTASANGVATGNAFANAIIGLRAGDGSATPATYTPTGEPGNWKPTSPSPPAFPQWGNVTPFELSASDQFKPAPPPALGTPEYEAVLAEVREIGSATSTTRTADQTASALFWDSANGLTWLKIGLIVGEDEGLSTLDFARAYSLLTVALADAAIAGFDAKYDYALWRPITAIREDPNNPDPSWSPLFTTPNHPSYPSAHSFFSGAADVILTSIFGDDEGFTFTIAGDTRSFTGIHQASIDGANSRLWGGIHFSTDNEAGLQLGYDVGQYVLASSAFNAAVPEPSVWLMMILGFAAIGAAQRRRGLAFQSSFA